MCLFWTLIQIKFYNVVFCDWLLLLTSLASWRFYSCYGLCQYYIPPYDWIIFYCYEYTIFCLFSHQLTDIWVVSTFLAAMNNAANEHVQVFMSINMSSFLCGHVFIFHTCPGVELLNHIVSNSVFCLRSFQTVFQSSCTSFESRQQYMRIPPHPHQHFLLSVFLIPATLVGMNGMSLTLWNIFLHTYVYLSWRNIYSGP